MLRRSLIVVVAGAAPAGQFPITIPAANGPVTITKQPTRIVSLSPTLTEDLFAIGAGKQVIAVDDQSDYPKSAPRTKLSGFTPNAEAVAAYNPDLVLVSYPGAFVSQMERLGITVLLEPAVDTMAEAYEQIRQVGVATGHTQDATKVVRGMQRKLTKLIRSVPKTRRHLRVYHELTPDYYSATSATFIGRVYSLFGLRNIADEADKGGAFPQLSNEFVIASDPDFIVLADTKCCGQSAATVRRRPGWSSMTAVRRGRVIALNDDIPSRWGPRIVDFVRQVGRIVRAVRG